MLLKSLDEFFFSQSALIAYQNCPRKFRYRYLEGLFWPQDWGSNAEQRKAIEEGRQFHLLAERYYDRGEAPERDSMSAELARAFQELVQFRPFQASARFWPEHELRVNDGILRLVAKYDLLYITPTGRVIIYDWKTNATPPKTNYWRNHLQTIVYRYVLSRAGGIYSPKGVIRPEDVTMVYWNPRHPHAAEPLNYSMKQMEKDETFLREIINEIKRLDYDHFNATGDQKRCNVCEYCPICHGKRALELELEKEDMDFDLDWEAVEGIEL